MDKVSQPSSYQDQPNPAKEAQQSPVDSVKGEPANDIAVPNHQINPRHGKAISAKALGDPAVNIEARFGKKLCKWSGFVSSLSNFFLKYHFKVDSRISCVFFFFLLLTQCKGKNVHPSEVVYVQPVKIQAVGDEIPAIIGTKKGGGLSLTHSSSSFGNYGPPAPYFPPPVPVQHHHDHHHHHKHKGKKFNQGWGGISSSSSGSGFGKF